MTAPQMNSLRRLLAPRHIAVFGGESAAEVIRQCRLMGYLGELWPVHPHRETIEGVRCFRSVADLPEPPDASFVGVPREATIDVVGELARAGAGGAVCYASGFAEIGGDGRRLQDELLATSGDLALLGPNCYGLLNYLDGAALWPDPHGGRAVERGVAIITQSGNVGLNLTMQRRGLPVAYLIAAGNLAGVGADRIIEALLDDPRVTAIGLHLEGLADVAAFSRVAALAHARRIPLVALKTGSSPAGARVNLSHTSAISGADALYDALFARFGIARVRDVAGLVETLKLCHVHGALPGRQIASASCSGGEAALIADLASACGVRLPDFDAQTRKRLRAVLGERVPLGNPLDYHTYIWGDLGAQTECFSALFSAGLDLHLLVLDLPRDDRCETKDWRTTLEAFTAAQRRIGARAAVVSSLPEGLPEDVALQLIEAGIAPMHGLADCVEAIGLSAAIGAAHRRAVLPVTGPADRPALSSREGALRSLDEWDGKQVLTELGVRVPAGRLFACAQTVAKTAAQVTERAVLAAGEIGFPVVVKALSPALAHKSDVGGVKLRVKDGDGVRAAVRAMADLSGSFLVEEMVNGAVAELLVGLRWDPQFGYVLTVGAGGVLVELLRDTATLLLPAGEADVRAALESLRIWPLLAGHRGRPSADVEAVMAVVMAVTGFGLSGGRVPTWAGGGRVIELEVNPLLVLPVGAGVVAADVLLLITEGVSADTPAAVSTNAQA